MFKKFFFTKDNRNFQDYYIGLKNFSLQKTLAQGIKKPEVLVISVVVLSCTKSMGDILHAIHYWTCKVIGGIYSAGEQKLEKSVKSQSHNALIKKNL